MQKRKGKANGPFYGVNHFLPYVFYEVTKLTDGYQNPTSRQENIEYDFEIWK